MSHLNISRPGSYSILVRPVNSRVAAIDHLLIGKTTKAPKVGARAFPSPTPTIASSGGDLHQITTHVPPDTALLRYSVAASLAATQTRARRCATRPPSGRSTTNEILIRPVW